MNAPHRQTCGQWFTALEDYLTASEIHFLASDLAEARGEGMTPREAADFARACLGASDLAPGWPVDLMSHPVD